MSIEGLDEFLDELRTLILEHPIVADWWAEINNRKDTADTPQTERDAYWKELFEAVVKGEMSDASANQAWYEYINK